MKRAVELSGVQAVRKADELRMQRDRKDAWPYPHIFPAPVSTPWLIFSAVVAVPAHNASATVLSYQVPGGMHAYLAGILQTVANTNTTLLPGDLLWTVTENPIPAGATVNTQANPVQGLVNVPVPLGQWTQGVWWPFPRVYEFDENTVLRSSALNKTGNVSSGSLISAFTGWLMPKDHVPLS